MAQYQGQQQQKRNLVYKREDAPQSFSSGRNLPSQSANLRHDSQYRPPFRNRGPPPNQRPHSGAEPNPRNWSSNTRDGYYIPPKAIQSARENVQSISVGRSNQSTFSVAPPAGPRYFTTSSQATWLPPGGAPQPSPQYNPTRSVEAVARPPSFSSSTSTFSNAQGSSLRQRAPHHNAAPSSVPSSYRRSPEGGGEGRWGGGGPQPDCIILSRGKQSSFHCRKTADIDMEAANSSSSGLQLMQMSSFPPGPSSWPPPSGSFAFSSQQAAPMAAGARGGADNAADDDGVILGLLTEARNGKRLNSSDEDWKLFKKMLKGEVEFTVDNIPEAPPPKKPRRGFSDQRSFNNPKAYG